MEKTGWIGIAGCVIAVIAVSLASFNMITQNIPIVSGSHDMGGMSGGMGSMGGGHDMGGMSGGMGSMGGGHDMGGMSGGMGSMGGGHDMGGMSGGMGSMGGGHDMGGMSGGMDHSMTGSTQQVCKQVSGMPPHYCEPTYMTMSSVQGIKISKVEPVSDTEVKAVIREITNAKVSQKLVFVGGSGYLSGATIIEDGWSKTKTVHLKFDGKGTIYDFTEMHLHLFPYTGE
jgi:hypothetical protein